MNNRIANILIMATTLLCTVSCSFYPTTRSSFTNPLEDLNDMEVVLYYASLAGSSHNTQPWKVEIISDEKCNIYADFNRHLQAADPTRRGLFISLGAFLENLQLAAGSLGYMANIEILAEKPTDILAATVTLSKGEKSNFDLNLLKNRKTSREPFDSTPINDLNIILSKIDTSNIHYFPLASDKGQYIAQQTVNAYTQQANRPDAKAELAQWVRFSNAHVKSQRDGLTTHSMGIKGFSGLVVRNFFKPKDAEKQSFVNISIEKATKQAHNCAGWLLIVQPKNSPSGWIKTGRLYERLNLICNDQGIGFHPMNALIEEQPFEQNANNELGIDWPVQMVVRVGYVKGLGKGSSVRREVKDFTITN